MAEMSERFGLAICFTSNECFGGGGGDYVVAQMNTF
jgi:hypothetical protein